MNKKYKPVLIYLIFAVFFSLIYLICCLTGNVVESENSLPPLTGAIIFALFLIVPGILWFIVVFRKYHEKKELQEDQVLNKKIKDKKSYTQNQNKNIKEYKPILIYLGVVTFIFLILLLGGKEGELKLHIFFYYILLLPGIFWLFAIFYSHKRIKDKEKAYIPLIKNIFNGFLEINEHIQNFLKNTELIKIVNNYLAKKEIKDIKRIIREFSHIDSNLILKEVSFKDKLSFTCFPEKVQDGKLKLKIKSSDLLNLESINFDSEVTALSKRLLRIKSDFINYLKFVIADENEQIAENNYGTTIMKFRIMVNNTLGGLEIEESDMAQDICKLYVLLMRKKIVRVPFKNYLNEFIGFCWVIYWIAQQDEYKRVRKILTMLGLEESSDEDAIIYKYFDIYNDDGSMLSPAELLSCIHAKNNNYCFNREIDIDNNLGKVRKVYTDYKDDIKINKLVRDEEAIHISDVDLMSGVEFENFVAKLFKNMGYKSYVTQASNDQGIDIIAEKGGLKIAIQAKCYSQPVGNHAIMEAVAGTKYYDADKTMVITNNIFTPSAIALAKKNDVQLWDRKTLSEKIDEVM